MIEATCFDPTAFRKRALLICKLHSDIMSHSTYEYKGVVPFHTPKLPKDFRNAVIQKATSAHAAFEIQTLIPVLEKEIIYLAALHRVISASVYAEEWAKNAIWLDISKRKTRVIYQHHRLGVLGNLTEMGKRFEAFANLPLENSTRKFLVGETLSDKYPKTVFAPTPALALAQAIILTGAAGKTWVNPFLQEVLIGEDYMAEVTQYHKF